MAENVRRRIAPVAAAGRVEETGGEFAIGEALTTIPTPGHTPGHCTVLAASRAGICCCRATPPTIRSTSSGATGPRGVRALAGQGGTAGGREGRDRDRRALSDPLAGPHPRGGGRLPL